MFVGMSRYETEAVSGSGWRYDGRALFEANKHIFLKRLSIKLVIAPVAVAKQAAGASAAAFAALPHVIHGALWSRVRWSPARDERREPSEFIITLRLHYIKKTFIHLLTITGTTKACKKFN